MTELLAVTFTERFTIGIAVFIATMWALSLVITIFAIARRDPWFVLHGMATLFLGLLLGFSVGNAL